MNYRYLFKVGIITGLTVLFSSCVKDGDFAQEDTTNGLPIIQSELMSSDFQAAEFLQNDTSREVLYLSDTTEVTLLTSDYFGKQLKRAELSFELTNSIDRKFIVNFEFLNALDEVKYTIKVPVSPGSMEKPVKVEINAIIEEPELTGLKEATKLVYKITLPEIPTLINSDSPGSIELFSIANLFMAI